jgi:hypothetical protein
MELKRGIGGNRHGLCLQAEYEILSGIFRLYLDVQGLDPWAQGPKNFTTQSEIHVARHWSILAWWGHVITQATNAEASRPSKWRQGDGGGG